MPQSLRPHCQDYIIPKDADNLQPVRRVLSRPDQLPSLTRLGFFPSRATSLRNNTQSLFHHTISRPTDKPFRISIPFSKGITRFYILAAVNPFKPKPYACPARCVKDLSHQ